MVVTHQQLDLVGVYPNSSGCERIESDTKVEDKKRKEQPGGLGRCCYTWLLALGYVGLSVIIKRSGG